jgi:hypothetical protein
LWWAIAIELVNFHFTTPQQLRPEYLGALEANSSGIHCFFLHRGTCDSGAGANATLMPEIAGRPQDVINYIVDIYMLQQTFMDTGAAPEFLKIISPENVFRLSGVEMWPPPGLTPLGAIGPSLRRHRLCASIGAV